jgi:hypothetical protein
MGCRCRLFSVSYDLLSSFHGDTLQAAVKQNGRVVSKTAGPARMADYYDYYSSH